VRILCTVAGPATRLLLVISTHFLERGTVGAKAICDDDRRRAVPAHCILEEFQRRPLVAGLGDKALQNLALMIYSPPKVVHLPVDLHEHLVQVPAPAAGLHTADPSLPDFCCNHRSERS